MKEFTIYQLEEKRRRPYYVDNDFFDNKHAFCNDLYYLRILYRDVGEWKEYSECEFEKENNNKIIFFKIIKKYWQNKFIVIYNRYILIYKYCKYKIFVKLYTIFIWRIGRYKNKEMTIFLIEFKYNIAQNQS